MRRRLLILPLVLGLCPITCVQETEKPWNGDKTIRFAAQPLPPRARLARDLGAFELQSAWSLTSPYSGFGGYSALLSLPGGRLLAISDNGRRLSFSPPGAPPAATRGGDVFRKLPWTKLLRDVEAATRDPATGSVWLSREGLNAISRHDADFREMQTVRPSALRDWRENAGAEAMTRLSDGRFIALEEAFAGRFETRRHRAVLFPRDPLLGGRAVRFTFAGANGFSPTDMAQLPDGRVLILMRRLVWPMPLRFAGRIMIADPAAIGEATEWRARDVARLGSSLPVDNFEGMAIEPGPDGHVTLWLISDQNGAATQRTMLWKLRVDPRRLP